MHARASVPWGYQSWEVANDSRDARRRILIRIAGPVAKERDASSKALAQKAKVGFRLRRLEATHITVPFSFELGARSRLKAVGAEL